MLEGAREDEASGVYMQEDSKMLAWGGCCREGLAAISNGRMFRSILFLLSGCHVFLDCCGREGVSTHGFACYETL